VLNAFVMSVMADSDLDNRRDDSQFQDLLRRIASGK
jgi:hypothetical protein